jgi:hypothetical protein
MWIFWMIDDIVDDGFCVFRRSNYSRLKQLLLSTYERKMPDVAPFSIFLCLQFIGDAFINVLIPHRHDL